jgi:hypothetical protein
MVEVSQIQRDKMSLGGCLTYGSQRIRNAPQKFHNITAMRVLGRERLKLKRPRSRIMPMP